MRRCRSLRIVSLSIDQASPFCGNPARGQDAPWIFEGNVIKRDSVGRLWRCGADQYCQTYHRLSHFPPSIISSPPSCIKNWDLQNYLLWDTHFHYTPPHFSQHTEHAGDIESVLLGKRPEPRLSTRALLLQLPSVGAKRWFVKKQPKKRGTIAASPWRT